MGMRIILSLALTLVVACGGGDEEEETTELGHEDTSGHEDPQEPDDGATIEGLMGTISPMAVERAMEGRMMRFLGCFRDRYHAVEVLGGNIELAFRVKVDGSVLWVYPRSSTIGDRDTERCILDAARSTRFSRPHGGEAEFAYPLTLDPPEEVRPPLNWDESRVSEQVERNRGEVVDCGRGPYTVTMYIARGGRVMAAGASTSEAERADDLDCVAQMVSAWEMPDPGSYPAKVTFGL